MSIAETFRAAEITYRRERLAAEFGSARSARPARRTPTVHWTNRARTQAYWPAAVRG